jgi:predicted DNA-binding mobile mystery protein A
MKRSQPLALWQLDRRLAGLAGRIGQRPVQGWVRTLREALGLSCSALGELIDVSGVRIFQIEHEELDGSVQLRTLERVAAGLNCQLFYVFVPDAPLESMKLNREPPRHSTE